MADVAMAGCSDLGTHAAAWQGSRGKLQRMLATADYRRLEPLFRQVIVVNLSRLSRVVVCTCATCQIWFHLLLQWPASHSTQPATRAQQLS